MTTSNSDYSSSSGLFKYLPGYASFLLNNYLHDFARFQLQLTRELNIPILQYFASVPEQQLLEISKERLSKFLKMIVENKVETYISNSLNEWVGDQLPSISRDKIIVEDITLISFMRRKAFRIFLPKFTTDSDLTINILTEIDSLTTEIDTRSFKILTNIQQELYRQTQEIALLGNWVWDLKKDKITWSDEIFRIYELEPQSLISYDLTVYNHPDDAEMINAQMRMSRETLQPHDFYYRIILDNGTQKILHAKGRVQATEEGEAFRMLGTLQDVTKQKKLELAVIEKQNLIQKITDLTPSMITVYNIHTGKYIFINQAIQSLLGYNHQEVMDKGLIFFNSIIHPDDKTRLTKKINETLAEANKPENFIEEPLIEFLYRALHKNGEYRWMQTFSTTFSRGKNGRVEEAINISIDVTEQIIVADNLKTKHKEIEEKNKELEYANKELESFTYIASHDLQEPLRKIKFFTGKLKPENNTEYYDRIINETTRMQQLINGLLEYSQLAGTSETFNTINLNDVAREVSNDLADLLNENKIELEIMDLPVVQGVRLLLHQLFTNLITNSVKYRRKNVNSKIRIYADVIEDDTIIPNAEKVNKITFWDNGIGFDNQYAKHIFQLFRRLHTKTAYPGTGVGLTICKKIVETHNGIIDAEGIPNEESNIYVYLPV